MELGKSVQVRSQDRYNGMRGTIAKIVPEGFYPYGVDLGHPHGIVYFSADELDEFSKSPENSSQNP